MKNIIKLQSNKYFRGFIQLIFALVILTGAAQAGSFTVTMTLDQLNVNSLREAIIAANETQDSTFFIRSHLKNGLLNFADGET